MITVTDCERVQANWFRMRAERLGGRVWTDGPLTWVDGPDGQNLLFPESIPPAEVARGVEHAARTGAPIVGAWLGLGVDASALAEAGFERGWSPWWMTAPIEAVLRAEPDPRIELRLDSDDYEGEYAAYREQLALAREEPPRAWYAAAYAPGRELAGHAWSFLDNGLAGVFDMAVWEEFQRRGFGSGLLRAVCAAAGAAGAAHAVLNATPDGKKLYRARGFTQIGEGITWWLHRRP
ncbi:GNAT family N-acetyltransferase [Amycolatopsis sp. CA-230715]|uniref:GNAT family N-acetyltransferase n=1 Tax=Amycolatopsis sp. CA-230715 TaxID=2745196 RepID=UPI001C00C92B|nr:GNAT family N-acetyltransferase [Amycolatopsis sp. CA-230715]